MDLIITQAKRGMEDTVTEISASNKNYMKFAYELRKSDTGNKYSRDLLNGQVKPDAMVKLTMANKFDDNDMQCKK